VTSPLVLNPERDPDLGPPVVVLDPRFYRSVEDLDLRIPEAPSLKDARSLRVEGDVRFGPGVRVRGDVAVHNPGDEPLHVPEGSVLSG
jgi:UTP--glucose-1-phosphate uridylyltransferase